MKKFSYAVLSIALTSTMTINAQTPKGVDRNNLDESIAPQEDFYQYACGGWMKANPIKAEYSRFGTFDKLGESSREQVRSLIDNLDTKNAAPGSITKKNWRPICNGAR